jgi:hypothetical protein
MVELDNRPVETSKRTVSDVGAPDGQDGGTKPPWLTKRMTFLLLLTLIAIAVIVALALIGPMAGGDVSIVLSL